MFHALGHYRAYGVALLVAGLFVSPAYALFDDNDKNNLYHIYEYTMTLNNFSLWYQDWIEDRQNAIDTSLSDIHNISRFLYGNRPSYNGETLFSIENDSRDALEDIRYILAPFTNTLVSSRNSFNPSRSSQVAVTNIAETYWLEKIYGRLGIVCNTNYWYLLGSGAATPYANATAGNWDFKTRQNDYLHDLELLMTGQIDHRIFLTRWADYRMTGFDFFRSFDYNNMTSEDKTAFENGYKFYFGSAPVGAIRNYLKLFSDEGNLRQKYYGTKVFRDYFENSGLDSDNFSSTNFFTADGSISNTDNVFTNSETSVFNKFATSFLPSSLFNPDEVNTNLFEYVDSDISETPSFNPAPIAGNGGLRSSSSSDFYYDFDDSSGDYDYNLINPLKTATDTVQHDTDLDNKFEQLAGLVNQRITSIFQNPLNTISSQPARWQASLIDKDMNQTEDYVDPQYSKSSDGVQFVCWCCESMMFFGFFSFCVRRSLRVQQARDVASAI